MSHTPGPWEIKQTDDIGWRILGPLEEGPHTHHLTGMRVLDVSVRQQVIATVHGIDDEDQANAHLIEAAPKLLEACKALRDWCKKEWPPVGSPFDPPTEQLLAAIAKAEGTSAT